MKEFEFLNYHTEYSCEGSINKPMGAGACFGKVFDAIDNNAFEKYQIVLYLGTEFAKTKHKSNVCVFTKQEVRNHIKLLKSLYPIRYSVIEYNDNDNYKKLLVTLYIENSPATFHKYALSWVRYLYEFPYNMLLRDAYILKKDSIFRFESIANLFNLVLGCYCEYSRAIHQIPLNGISTRMKISEIRDTIKEVSELNNIYSILKDKDLKIPDKIKGFSVHSIEYWKDGFEYRKPIYMKVYKDIKK